MVKSKILLTISLLILIVPFLTSHLPLSNSANAQDATGSSTVDPETVKENIKKRIEAVVAGTQDDQGPLRGWVGQIETITTDSLTITGPESTRLVALTKDTTIVKDGQGAAAADLAIGNQVIAMGRTDNNSVLNALRLVASDDEPEKPAQRIIAGPIDSIQTDEDLIIVSSPTGTTTLTFTKDSLLTDNLTTNAKLDLENLNSGDQVIAIYLPGAKDPSLLNLLRLHLTKSARATTATASPSATPKPKQ